MPDRRSKFSADVLCECGCGLTAPLVRDGDKAKGRVAGQPLRYRVGHQARGRTIKSYRMTSAGGRFELAHRYRAAVALGKPLPPRVVVHHADGSRREDAQLVLCENQAYHMLLHARMRVVAAGGNPNTDKICWRCRKVKSKAEFPPNRGEADGISGQCRPCKRESQRAA